MKKFFNFLMAGALVMGLASCSQDEPGNPGGGSENNGNGTYAKVRLSFPQGRAADDGTTGKVGVEIGNADENNVGSILVVLAQKSDADTKYTYLTSSLSDAAATANSTYTIMFTDTETLLDHAGETVYMFAYCNPDPTFAAMFADPETARTTFAEKDFTEEICKDKVAGSWTPKGFMMTSVGIKSVTLPAEGDLKGYTSAANAWDMTEAGAISVVRTAARFDIRDASPAATGAFTYSIKDEDSADRHEMATITFTKVALFNQREEFYFLPRITDGSVTTLCPGFGGMENDYVVSPSGARNYTSALPARMDAEGRAKLTWTSLAAVLNGTADDHTGYTPGEGDNADDLNDWDPDHTDKEDDGVTPENPANKSGYHIWRYTTENTFTAAETDMISSSNVTGYVFEAEVNPTVTDEQKEALNFTPGENTMYVFGNKLYFNELHIYREVQKAPVSKLATAFDKVFTATENDGNVTITKKEGADAEAAGFIIYEPTADGKYICYYFAYNVHNNDGQASAVGPMEYGVVRNNVYKLAITKVTMFGGYVPPKVDDWEVYFKLSIRVYPWVVRVNNIEF